MHQQTANKQDYEVIVVDNNSPDNTFEYIEAQISGNIHYVLEMQQGLPFARNKGIEEAKGEIISFLDDDACPDEFYIERMLAFFDNHPECIGIGGKIEPIFEGTQRPKWMISQLLPLVAALDLGNTSLKFGKGKFPIGANMAYRKEAFTTYGGFDNALGRRGASLEGGEEKDLAIRLQNAGFELWYVPEISVTHTIPGKRLQTDYIKGLAKGVGSSERKRMSKYGFIPKFVRFLEELKKIIGSPVLASYYLLIGNFSAATMIIQFRIWVIQGYLHGKK